MVLMSTPARSKCVAVVWRLCRWRHRRHTCATLLLAAGVPSRVVQERLGHTKDRDDPYRVRPRTARPTARCCEKAGQGSLPAIAALSSHQGSRRTPYKINHLGHNI